jgi:hypothetical protein
MPFEPPEHRRTVEFCGESKAAKSRRGETREERIQYPEPVRPRLDGAKLPPSESAW